MFMILLRCIRAQIDSKNTRERYKSRWVVRGCLEIPGVNHDPLAMRLWHQHLHWVFCFLLPRDTTCTSIKCVTKQKKIVNFFFLNSPLVHEVWVRYHVGYYYTHLDTHLRDGTSGYMGSSRLRPTVVRSIIPDLWHRSSLTWNVQMLSPVSKTRSYTAVTLYMLVHVHNYACAYLDPGYFAAWLQHFRGSVTNSTCYSR